MMDTSKTSSIKSLLMRAWRERWSDVQWGINIKQVLPRGVSGDVYNLADCILQQALIGPGPNTLVLSYLRHCLSSQIVSYGAVLQGISKYQAFQKPHCILSLLDLLKDFQKSISCHGNADDCMALCVAMVTCVLWLYCAILTSMNKLAELKQSTEHSLIVDKASDILQGFTESTFIQALVFIGKQDDSASYQQILEKCSEIETQLGQMQGIPVPKDNIENTILTVRSLEHISLVSIPDTRPQLLASSLNGMLTLDTILNPTGSIQHLADQIFLLRRLEGYSWPVIYCEMVRSCQMGLIDAAGNNTEELKWSSFTFLKLPQVIQKIHNKIYKSSTEPSTDLEEGLELLLLMYTPLLDQADAKNNCDCVTFLLTEFCKIGLVGEAQEKKLLQCRQNSMQKIPKCSEVQQKASSNPDLIIRAESTVGSILKASNINSILETLDADYSKNQEALLGVLCHMMAGKSFELILAAAAATGKLNNFAVKLIKFNEFNKQLTAEAGKVSQTRALLFDITFLMLCHIVQHYGSEVVSSNGETKDSFFAQWLVECMAEHGHYKSPDAILVKADPARVDQLLQAFNSPEGDFKMGTAKWNEVCMNAPAAIREVLIAWEHGSISTDNVKVLLDNVKSRMCCLPVCLAAWLCSYINIAHHDQHIKPMSMLQELQKPLAVEPGGGESSQGSGETATFYKERSGLMIAIIKRMFYDIHPPTAGHTKLKLSPSSPASSSHDAANKLLRSVVSGVFQQGWLDHKAIYTLENLYHLAGPLWFCTELVEEGLDFVFSRELQTATDLLFAIFQVDIEQCATVLLSTVLPGYLQNSGHWNNLVEPKSSALARLVVMCVYSALVSQASQKGSERRRSGGKRSRKEFDMDDYGEGSGVIPPSKYRLIMGSADMDDTPIGLLGSTECQNNMNLSEPLNKALVDLFRLFSVIVSDTVINQRTHFVFSFLEQVVFCGKDDVTPVLQYMPLSLVSQLLKCLPDMFTMQLVLALSSITTAASRKVTAKMLCQLQNYKVKTDPNRGYTNIT